MNKFADLLDRQAERLEQQLYDLDDFYLPRRNYEAEAEEMETRRLFENGVL